MLMVKSSYSGPVPSAEMAECYEKMQSGSADRFLTMAEQKQSMRHQQEMVSLQNDTRRIRASTVISVSFAVVAVIAIRAGHPIVGVFIVSAGVLPTIIRILVKELFTQEKD